MRRIFFTLLVLGVALITSPPVFAQDTLLDFSDVEFTDGQDTSSETTGYMEVPDDVVFSDGQDIADTASDQPRLAAGSEASAGGGSPQTLWGIFIAGVIGGFAAFLMPCIYPM